MGMIRTYCEKRTEGSTNLHTYTHTRRNNGKKRRINEFDVHTPLNHYLCIGILHTLSPFFPFETCSVRRHHILSNYRSENLIYHFQISYACRLYIFRRHSKRAVRYKKTMFTQQTQKMRSVFKVFYLCHRSLARSFIRSFAIAIAFEFEHVLND